MAATIFVIPMVRFHMQLLQLWFLAHFRPTQDLCLTVPKKVLITLTWWTSLDNLLVSIPFQPQPFSLLLTTDASLQGWGAHCGDLTVQGL